MLVGVYAKLQCTGERCTAGSQLLQNSYLLQLWHSVSHQYSLVKQRKEGLLEALQRGTEMNTTAI